MRRSYFPRTIFFFTVYPYIPIIVHNKEGETIMAVKYKKDEELSVSSDMEWLDISYYKNEEYLRDINNFVRFVKAVEKMVRKHPDYDMIIKDIHENYMDHCQFLGNISIEDAVLEVHHGPLLTLFDICMIIINYLLKHNKEKITTFYVAEIVMREHLEGHIQFVVLCQTVHQAIDTGQVFINLNQGIGDIQTFLIKYRDGIDDMMMDKINQYIDLSKKFESTDNGILELEKKMITWKYRNLKD